MVRLAIASVCLVAIVWLSVVGGGQTSAAAEKAPIQLTERDYDRVVQASNGDTIEVWLPNSMPYSWGLMEALPVLQPLPAATRLGTGQAGAGRPASQRGRVSAFCASLQGRDGTERDRHPDVGLLFRHSREYQEARAGREGRASRELLAGSETESAQGGHGLQDQARSCALKRRYLPHRRRVCKERPPGC